MGATAQSRTVDFSDDKGPALLSFEDLVALSSQTTPAEPLRARLDTILTTPFVHNESEAELKEANWQQPSPLLRVGLWNIERGLNFELIRATLTDTDRFESLAVNQSRWSASRRGIVESQMARLQGADMLVLDEVDWGMKRTEYRNVAQELAAALKMNYVYGVEFVEVDPIFGLGTEKVELSNPAETGELQRDLTVDSARYRGLHGTAILSRYPIVNARVFRLPVCYYWYGQEAREAARLEKGKCWAVRRAFGERIAHEIRRGGRMALIADLAVPGVPEGRVTIVAPHLENRCAPACRRRQMQALLDQIRPIRNPLVLAGDLNTTSQTNVLTSVRNEIMARVTDYQFWIGQTISWFHPMGIYQHVLAPVRYFHGYNDPTAFHVPVLWNNKEKPLFGAVERFRFADGQTFDFRGDPERTLNLRGGKLADSNQRAWKGFVPTYVFAQDYAGFVGRFKLDWIFVKPYISDSRTDGSWLFAPLDPHTMRELNQSVPGRISDHAPLTVDLPLTQPLPDRR
jgi:endonuclease/exonuclease/phosphatase family metal-dependent hydrolase